MEFLFNKVAGPRLATLLKKRLQHRCFPVNIIKLLRTAFSIEHLWWLLLSYYTSYYFSINYDIVNLIISEAVVLQKP